MKLALAALATMVVLGAAQPTDAQTNTQSIERSITPSISQRGFVEAGGLAFRQKAPNDARRVVGDVLVREEVFVKPAPWVQFAAGVDLRANSHDQIATGWTPDLTDRGTRRPRVSVRRLTATLTRKGFTVDAGKQFIRWGKTDIINPSDRFAPRDFLNVITSEFLPVAGVRASMQIRDDTIEDVWVPRLTPSRVPLLDQRWTAVPEGLGAQVRDGGARIPDGSQIGIRWSHFGAGFEYALSFFDGFNHLPNIESRVVGVAPVVELIRVYPEVRAYGVEAAVPTRWFTIKGEAEYFTSPASDVASDDYVLYVLQLERQSGEWVFVGGYAGEIVTARRFARVFSPDRGMTKSIVGRAAYTIDPRRSVAFESAVRQTGDGVYGKAEYSETRGGHWRLTLTGVVIAGHTNDFLGQYHRNSHIGAAVRYSF